MTQKTKSYNKIHIFNRKVSFEYHIIDSVWAGIVLQGTEIKSIRNNHASIRESFCQFKNETELYVVNMHIKEYDYGTHYNHEPKRERKLLLNKKELKKFNKGVKTSSMTIVPRTLIINNKGLAKLEICLVKGKKLYDKRQSIKERDLKRDMGNKKLM